MKAYIELKLMEVQSNKNAKLKTLDSVVILPTRSPEQERSLAINIVNFEEQEKDLKTIIQYVEDIIQNVKLIGIYLELLKIFMKFVLY